MPSLFIGAKGIDMELKTIITVLISFLALLVSTIMMIIAVITLLRNSKKDQKADIKNEDATLQEIKTSILKANMKLDQVCAVTNEIRTDSKLLASRLTELEKKVAILENRFDLHENDGK